MVEIETLESELQRVTAEIWGMTCETEVDALVALPASAAQAPTLAGVSDIGGGWSGAVAVQVPLAVAQAAAARMFCLGSSEQPSLEQVEDALKEISNVTGGNLKTVLPEDSQLAIPRVIACDNFSLALPGCEIFAELAFSAWSQPFIVRVFRAA